MKLPAKLRKIAAAFLQWDKCRYHPKDFRSQKLAHRVIMMAGEEGAFLQWLERNYGGGATTHRAEQLIEWYSLYHKDKEARKEFGNWVEKSGIQYSPHTFTNP